MVAVADAVLYFRFHFSKRNIVSFRYEDGIITEAIVAFFLMSDHTLQGAFKYFFQLITHQSDGAEKSCASGLFSFKIVQ